MLHVFIVRVVGRGESDDTETVVAAPFSTAAGKPLLTASVAPALTLALHWLSTRVHPSASPLKRQ